MSATGGHAAEPTLAGVQAEFPDWECVQGISGMYHAEREATSQRVIGEDPLDLRDQIKAAEARHAWLTLAIHRG